MLKEDTYSIPKKLEQISILERIGKRTTIYNLTKRMCNDKKGLLGIFQALFSQWEIV